MFQLTVFRGSFFKILLQIQQEFFFLSTCKHRQAKCCLFLGICWCSCLILRKNVIFWNCHETRSHFETRPKTVNIQGYSELREPIRRRENCCSLIWWILILIVFVSVVLGEELKFFTFTFYIFIVNDIENYTGYFFEALIHKLFDSPSLTAMSQNRLHVLVGCFTVPLFTVGSDFKVSKGPGYPDPKIKSPRIYLVKMFFDKHQGLSRTIKRFQLLSRPWNQTPEIQGFLKDVIPGLE